MSKNQKPLVSVLIVTYNRSSLLKNTLDSIINQTYSNIEIIVVDDSTNNESEKLCKKYGNKIIHFHRYKRGGIPSAYNFGIEQIHGEWVKFLSDDNLLFPNTIQTLLEHVQSPQYCIIYSDYVIIDDQGKEIGIHKEKDFSNYNEFVAEFWNTMQLNGETTLIHKSCLNKVGEFDSQFGSMSDFDWFLRSLVYKCNFIHVPKILLKHKLHKTQVSHLELSDHESLRKWNQTENKIREKNKKLFMKKNIQEWKYFELYQKKYKNILKSHDSSSPISVWRKTYRLVPLRIRRFIKRSWNTSIKGFVEFTCPICQMKDIQRLLYVEPSAKLFTCINCNTTFEKKHISQTVKHE